jgi:hypothetical protein
MTNMDWKLSICEWSRAEQSLARHRLARKLAPAARHGTSAPAAGQTAGHTFCRFRTSVASLRARWLRPSHALVVMLRLVS